MRHQCPNCRQYLESSGPLMGQIVICPYCQSRIQTPAPPARRDVPVVMMPQQVHPWEFRDEEELHEERRERHEERLERRDVREVRRRDRDDQGQQNMAAVVGLTFSATSLLLVVGGMIVGKALPAYLVIALMFGFPGALIGLIFSLIGCMARKSGKPLAIGGAITGAVLLLLLIPTALLILFSK